MAEGENQMAQNRSMLRNFVASIATMSGDLSNITAPPFVLDTKSTVELPSFWAENPSIFCAPAQSDDPAVRALRVLKWFLSSLRNQNYMGHSEDHGVKKPLNAFLGELFVARWEDDMGTTRLVSEQVSHHPPITACRVWNDEHGVSASGYTRQTITFSGSVSIKQTGHALFHLSKLDETYLIPLPELKVKGVLTGAPYPELGGTYYIPSTNGYMSVIHFSGKGWFSGTKHACEASLFKEEEGEDHPIYTIKGTWNGEFIIRDEIRDEEIEVFDVMEQLKKSTKLTVEPLEEQDPWETRRAWAGVISSLNSGDMKGVVNAKSTVEQGQRQMRKDEEAEATIWEQTFFTSTTGDEVAEALMQKIPGSHTNLEQERKDTKGVWTFDAKKWEGNVKPYRGEAVPDNSHRGSRRGSIEPYSTSARNSVSSHRASISGPNDFNAMYSSSQLSSPQRSRQGSMDVGRSSMDSTASYQYHDDPRQRKRNSIVSKLAMFNLFSKSETKSEVSSPHSRSGSISGLDPQHCPSIEATTTPETPARIQNIHKDIPGPQVEQTLQLDAAAHSASGVKDMSLKEKMDAENALRNVYASTA